MKGRELRDYLGEDYCARCDSFHVEQRDYAHGSTYAWCGVCWNSPLRLSKRLRDLIEAALA